MELTATPRRNFARAGIVLVTVMAVFSLAIPKAHATTPAEQWMATLINRSRIERGLPALRLWESFSWLARKHSATMAAQNKLYHNPYLATWLNPWPWKILGENVGYGPTITSLHNAFMASPGHRANILDTRFRYVGVGIVASNGTVWVTVIFYG